MISKTELTFSAANYKRFRHNPINYISSLLHNCISGYCPLRSPLVGFLRMSISKHPLTPCYRPLRTSSFPGRCSRNDTDSHPNRIICSLLQFHKCSFQTAKIFEEIEIRVRLFGRNPLTLLPVEEFATGLSTKAYPNRQRFYLDPRL